jgi:hypothetical protein
MHQFVHQLPRLHRTAFRLRRACPKIIESLAAAKMEVKKVLFEKKAKTFPFHDETPTAAPVSMRAIGTPSINA